MTRICFFTLNAYDMLVGATDGHVGGAQLQQVLIGRELVERGHDVFFVEHATSGKEEQTVDGITVRTKPKPAGNPLARAVEAARGTRRLLTEIDPETVYFRVLDFELLVLAWYCWRDERRFVYNFAHDSEVTDDPVVFSDPIKSSSQFRYAIHRALESADALVAQNQFQYDRATDRFDTDIHKIPNGYAPADSVDPIPVEGEQVVLWVSRFVPWKRPEIVFDLARDLPEIEFIVVGQNTDVDTYENAKREAATLDNVRFEGFVPFTEIDRYFVAADVFLNTSVSEGFPNTFLQAWAYGTPVASLNINPDGILTDFDIGIDAAGSYDALRDGIEAMTADAERYETLATNARRYFRENHHLTAVVDRYDRLLAPDSD